MTNIKKLTEEDYKAKLKESSNGEIEILTPYINSRTKVRFKNKVCKHEWEAKPSGVLNYTRTCPICYKDSITNDIETFRRKVKEVGNFTVVEGEKYVNNITPIKVVHEDCGTEFYVRPATILHSGSCIKCRHNKPFSRKTTEQFEQDLYDKHGNEYILKDGCEYTSANEKVTIIHNKKGCNHEWDVRAAHILRYSACPECKLSKGETFIAKLLKKNKIAYKSQYTYPDLKNTKRLPFDFAVMDTKDNVLLLIEYDGVQHFEPINHFGGVDKFVRTQKNDEKKNKYCKDNNIPLLRVNYKQKKEEIEDIILSKIKK